MVADTQLVLANYRDAEGRFTMWPARRKVQIALLETLVDAFEVGRRYTEIEVNAVLNRRHTFGDPATLRRDMVDLGLLHRERDATAYWIEPRDA
ncbi:MAG TPA: DUF2087 domain-containing protein [Fimbriimonadaceae bacterium]|nr:DUF2087 domain-containing protein [Fimbriimonadaceae bacterium]